jgi:hypothetical protein
MMPDDQPADPDNPADGQTADANNAARIVDALRLWQAGNQQGAVDVLRPLADSGDIRAAIPLLQFMWSMPPGWQEGIPYARQVAEAGVPAPFLVNYVNNMLNDPPHREDGLVLARHVIASGIPLELLGPAQNAALRERVLSQPS